MSEKFSPDELSIDYVGEFTSLYDDQHKDFEEFQTRENIGRQIGEITSKSDLADILLYGFIRCLCNLKASSPTTTYASLDQDENETSQSPSDKSEEVADSEAHDEIESEHTSPAEFTNLDAYRMKLNSPNNRL
ncbi:hypothetical protein HHI36_015035 [Cryptolaemus montrouzieri]|uniref:Uncharacterized protein n=1 Tax=Cryptolaemus montrouzieri TaxID=559131 RepID=A0ABD2N4H5_9CUCU